MILWWILLLDFISIFTNSKFCLVTVVRMQQKTPWLSTAAFITLAPKVDMATIQIWPLLIAHKQFLHSYFYNRLWAYSCEVTTVQAHTWERLLALDVYSSWQLTAFLEYFWFVMCFIRVVDHIFAYMIYKPMPWFINHFIYCINIAFWRTV